MNMIELEGIWKKYTRGEKINSLRDQLAIFFKGLRNPTDILLKEEFWALKDINLAVPKGGVLGIIGANGAGKSTLFNILAGIIQPTKGRFEVKGRLSAIIEITAGFHPDFTGRENVYFNGSILGMTRKEVDRKFDQIVEFSGIDKFIDTPVKRYSSGMLARLGFSVAAHVDPDVLLVDEVLSVGDIMFQAKCVRKMKELVHRGATVILVSHNLSLIDSFCNHVALLSAGEIVKEGKSEEVVTYYEGLIKQKAEQELKEEIAEDHALEGVHSEAKSEIANVTFFDIKGKERKSFSSQEPIVIRIDYSLVRRLKRPVVAVEILRSDGIVCCESNTLDSHAPLDHLQGDGSLEVRFEQTNLIPEIYYVKVSIWDENIIHPYAVKRMGVFKIESSSIFCRFGSVSYVRSSWVKPS